MRLRNIILASFMVLALGVFASAQNTPIGTFSNELVGCDPALGFNCQLNIDEVGHISFTTNGDVFGGPGVLQVTAVATSPTSNPAWVDDNGRPLEVQSYLFGGINTATNTPMDLIAGTVGLCEGHDPNPNGGCAPGDLSDVVVITNLGNGMNRIDVISDNEVRFAFPTNVSVIEDDSEFGHYHALDADGDGVEGGGEGLLWNIDSSNSVPEPASLVLLGSGLLGIAGTLRRKLK